jgi:beta-phosphoglucomutase-like phosphatase (HAD superfamily)
MHKADLIIFDCDGVLVDTEPLTNRVLAQTITEAGWKVDAQYSVTHFKGRNLNDIHKEVEAHLGKDLPDLLDIYRKRMYDALKSHPVPPISGIHELLDILDTLNSHRCVATNAPLKKATMTLTGSKLIDRFVHPTDPSRPTMFSAYEVGKWKPDPALFLHAAESMGHHPRNCIVVEDSVSGVLAARNANMRVIGLASLTPAKELANAGATQIIESHNELVSELI